MLQSFSTDDTGPGAARDPAGWVSAVHVLARAYGGHPFVNYDSEILLRVNEAGGARRTG
jgi:hypothetical protein